MIWSDLQYLMGLSLLGHDVYYLEDSDNYPSCYNPVKDKLDIDPTYGLEVAKRAFEWARLGSRWAYYDQHTSQWFGPCAGQVLEICKTADCLLNLAGINPLRPWVREIPKRVFIDKDPVFTQVRHLTNPARKSLALQHTTFLSLGEHIGLDRCAIPKDGLPWRPTRHPIVLQSIPVTLGVADGKFTTVMLWDSYPPCQHNGVSYGMKSDSFGPYMTVPRKVADTFELAIGSPTVPREKLRRNGWSLHDPIEVTHDLDSYLKYIRASKAEFSIAKHGYVLARTGWFSERSATYLSSGRPVVIQETGFSDWMETGAGVIPFSTPEEAVAGIKEINRQYKFHCRAAREVAEEYFDARKLLIQLIECIMNH
jgi:hypothetical protein